MWKDVANLAGISRADDGPRDGGVTKRPRCCNRTRRDASTFGELSYALGKQQILRELGFLKFSAFAAPVIARESWKRARASWRR